MTCSTNCLQPPYEFRNVYANNWSRLCVINILNEKKEKTNVKVVILKGTTNWSAFVMNINERYSNTLVFSLLKHTLTS